ncbi:MAG TPA: hypothetical protein VKD19_09915 [Pseudolabrys sp.]|nr:hypothetical protein [Pseudolabrys sp.]
MKCVAQMPQPVAAPAATIHIVRKRPTVADARLNKLMAVVLATKQTKAATMTSRQSCSVARQLKTWNMLARPKYECAYDGSDREFRYR